MDAAVREQKLRTRNAAQRLLKIREARTDLRAFIELMMPDGEDPENPDKSEYQDAPHCQLLRSVVEEIEAGTKKRMAVSIPPQHGKTIHLSTYGPAWILGRNPRARIVIATYNEIRASEIGEDFRTVIQSDTYKAIFPDVQLTQSSKSTTKMGTTKKGRVFFVSAGGTVTGRTAQYFIIDDPMKDDEELQSDTFREKRWKWFFSVAYSRGSKRTPILILHTRWHADDLIGRLCDPNHPERKKRFEGIAEDWTYLNVSGVVQDENLANALGLELKVPTDKKVIAAFGEKPMAALWEADKDLAHFAEWKKGEPLTFSALVMGQPSIEDGEYFNAKNLIEYDRDELPEDLRYYGASDHAVSEKQYRDYTVAGIVGFDQNDVGWVLPDLFWERCETDTTVERLLYFFKTYSPDLWFMESELISKSFGPFLHKRMVEENIYTTIQKITRSKDKRTHARSIQGRISMQMLRFPRFAPWWADARSQMLQFDRGANDDFVDFMANMGMGLMQEFGASKPKDKGPNLMAVGSPQWIIKQALLTAQKERRDKAVAGW